MRRLLVCMFLLSTLAFGQSQGTLSGGAKVSTTSATPPPPVPLTITSSTCAPGLEAAFNCTLSASGGTPPYSWSGTAPFGLSLSAAGIISGAANATGSNSFTVTVTDSASPVATASASVSITINPLPTGCGPPTYNCARTDYITQTVTSNGTVPPTNGCQPNPDGTPPVAWTAGNVDYKPCASPHPCTAGMTENSSNPTLPMFDNFPANVNHASNLQNCGNLYGLNEVFIDPRYHNVEAVRVSDWGDRLQGCASPQTNATPSFDANEEYFVIPACGVKWFDPVNFHVNTSKNPAGYVITSGGTRWTPPTGLMPSQTIPASFFLMQDSLTLGIQILHYHVTNGVLDSTAGTLIGDMRFAIPCWSDTTGMTSVNASAVPVPMCQPWQQRTYPGGSVIVPVHNNAAYTHVTGCTITTPCPCDPQVNPQHCHIFEQISHNTCTTGTTEPHWVIGETNGTWLRPGVHITSVSLTGGIATFTYDAQPLGWEPIKTGQLLSIGGTVSGDTNQPDMFNFNLTGVNGQQIIQSATATTFTIVMPLCTAQSMVGGRYTGCINTGQANLAAIAQPSTARTIVGPSPQATTVIHDGTCEWADMYIPQRAAWTSNRRVNIYDTIFGAGIGNYGGQDAVGDCGVINFNDVTITYSYLNACTGNAYKTVCAGGGTTYQCTGGHWARTYLGNVYEQNTFFAETGTDPTHSTPIPTSRIVLHGANLSKSGEWTTPSANQCGLADSNAVIADTCWYSAVGTLNLKNGSELADGTRCTLTAGCNCTTAWCTSGVVNLSRSIQGGSYVWEAGTINFTTARTIFGSSSPGHANVGYNVWMFVAGQSGPKYASRRILPWNTSLPVGRTGNWAYFDLRIGSCTLPGGWTDTVSNCTLRQCDPIYGCTGGLVNGLGTAPGVSDCLAIPCWGRISAGTGTVNPPTGPGLTGSGVGLLVNWDQHMDWNSNRGTDAVPACMNTYIGSTVAGYYIDSIFGTLKWIWPPKWPWADEIICFATDGSNKVFRQANQWNTASSLWFSVAYGYPGGTSNDGKFYLYTTDLWCTIGGGVWSQWSSGTNMVNGVNLATQSKAVYCGMPFQSDHDYVAGEYVSPVQTAPTLRCESMVFKVVTAGRSGKMANANGVTGSGDCTAATAESGYPPNPPSAVWNCAGTASNLVLGRPGCRVKQADGTAEFEYVGRTNTIPALVIVKLQ